MMRKFKHSTLGWIAEEEKVLREEEERMYQIKKPTSKQSFYVYPELIEWCSDREEVIEDDWISNAWKEYEEYWTTNRYEEFRGIIEKHAPKQVKFTKKEFIDFFMLYRQNETTLRTEIVFDFLRQHNLLDEESIVWEWSMPCQHESNWEVYTSNPPQYKCEKCWAFYKN